MTKTRQANKLRRRVGITAFFSDNEKKAINEYMTANRVKSLAQLVEIAILLKIGYKEEGGGIFE